MTPNPTAVKVRASYPSPVRIIAIIVILPIFFELSSWVTGGNAILPWILTGGLALTLGFITVCDLIPMRVGEHAARRLGVVWRPGKVVEVTAKTARARFVHGASSTVIHFSFKDTEHGMRLTDARYPMMPNVTGYSQEEAAALLAWLSNVPESVPGYEWVTHMKNMLELEYSRD